MRASAAEGKEGECARKNSPPALLILWRRRNLNYSSDPHITALARRQALDIRGFENYILTYSVIPFQQEVAIMMYTLAHLEKEKLADVQSLEKSLGKTLVAFAPKEVSFVTLKDDEISRIQQIEKKLNISLVAVK
jgi:hypothetical protein